MPVSRQLTTAELDRLIQANIERSLKVPRGTSEYDRLKREFEGLVKQKDRIIKDYQSRFEREASRNKELQDQLNRNLNDGESNRDRTNEDRRNGTAGDAQKELDRRKNRASKNPPRGDLKPGDTKKPPGGNRAKPVGTGKGTFKPSIGIAIPLPTSSGGAAQDLVDRFFPDPDDKRDPMYKSLQGKDPLTVGARFSRSIQRGVAQGLVSVTPLGAVINAVDKEVKHFQGVAPKAENVLNQDVSGGQIATLVQGLASAIANLGAISSGITEKQNALISQNQAMMQVLQIIGAATALNPSIMAAVTVTESKLRQVNFAAIKASADKAASIAQENKTKLGAANFTLQNQAAQLAKTKLEIIDATQLMATSRLAEKKWNILDATQLMATSRLAERKWDILDATQLMATSRLAEKKWNILDATQLMGTSRMAETKWGILDVTQLMRYSRAAETNLPATKAQLTRIESKIAQPVSLAPVLNAINAIPSKFPAPTSISGLTSQIASLSTQISGVNGAIASIPSRIPAPSAPNLTPILNAIANIRIPTPAAPDLSILTNQLNGLSAQIVGVNGAIASIPSLIPTPAQTDLRPVLNAIDAVPSKIKVPEPNLTPVLRALDPIASNAADISAALSAPLFKTGMPIKAHDELLKIGQQTDSGINPTIVKSLPAMVMALSAVAYTRSGHHRLGGTFDKSVMNPTQGKVKITDMVGLHKWSFDQIDQRLGLPTAHTVIDASGRTQTKSFQSIQDAIEESNALNIVAGQDIEVVERYLFALTQDLQKLMQIALQTREDVDLVIDDLGCKFKETKRSHPTHINLTAPGASSSLSKLFEKGRVHYVGREWADVADKNQKLLQIGYDSQIAAMSNKFELDKTNPQLPLANSRATKGQSDDIWRTFVSTMEEPPEGYVTPGNPIPDIKEIVNGTTKEVPKPSNPLKKLGK